MRNKLTQCRQCNRRFAQCKLASNYNQWICGACWRKLTNDPDSTTPGKFDWTGENNPGWIEATPHTPKG